MVKKTSKKNVSKLPEKIPYFDNKISDLTREKQAKVLGVLIDHVSSDAGMFSHISEPKGAFEHLSIKLEGKSYAGGCNSAEITFVKGEECISPYYEETSACIKIEFPKSEFPSIISILSKCKSVLCIYWESPSVDEKGAELYTYDPL